VQAYPCAAKYLVANNLFRLGKPSILHDEK
jgi:hypothetical protein